MSEDEMQERTDVAVETLDVNKKREIRGRYRFKAGEKVLCFQGPLMYEAKCLDVREKISDDGERIIEYFVHYVGWKKSWDEWLTETRLLKYDEQNVVKQKELQRAQKDAKVSKGDKDKIPDAITNATNETLLVSDSEGSSPCSSLSKNENDEKIMINKKRKRSEPAVEKEEDFRAKVEIKVKMLDELKPWLVDDWDLICRQRKLVSLPSKTTVDAIVDEYVKYKCSQKSAASSYKKIVTKFGEGLKEYFNAVLGNQLLYKFERAQYNEILAKYPNREMSSVYGGLHLLRMFVILGSLLIYTDIDERTVLLLQAQLQDFLKYLHKNNSLFFNSNSYELAPSSYLRLSQK